MTVAGAVYENYQYVYDINAGIPRLLVERKDNQDLGQYIWGNRLLGRISPDGQEFYHQDALGSTKMMTDLFGQTVNSYGYDVFGTPNASRDGSLLAWKSDKRYSTPMRKGSGSDARTTAA